jgi:hypothetical protein
MAVPVLNAPSLAHQPFNTGDAVEGGDTAQLFIQKVQAAFTEVYGRTGGAASLAASGLVPQQIPLGDATDPTGVYLTAAGAAGTFGVSMTAGTSIGLTGESTNANSKTDVALIDYVVPSNYVAGQNLTLTVNAQSQGAGTNTVRTVNANAYAVANNGTQGADLINVAAKTITGAAADYVFTIVGTGLVPGSHLLLKLTTVITTSAGANNALINSVRVS